MSFVSIHYTYCYLFIVSDFETVIFEILINLKITINSLYINVSNIILMKKTLFSKICTFLKML